MKYRLIALDLDGTLLNSRMEIQPATVDALDKVRSKGIEVMVVTGRHHVAAYPYWHQLRLELPVVCCNGTYLYDYIASRPLETNPLPKEQALRLLEIVRKHAIYCMVYVDDAMAYESTSTYSEKFLAWAATLPSSLRPSLVHVERFEQIVDQAKFVWKFAMASNDVQSLFAFERDVRETLGLSCEWSASNRIDVAQTGNTKGSRLAQWVRGRGIKLSEVIAFGDHRNDIDMLDVVGMGVAMGNADPVVQSRADWVTGTNDGTGIADALQRFVLEPA